MKAYEFPAKVTSEGKINLTDDILKYLAVNQDVRVIILVNEQTNSEADEVEEQTEWQTYSRPSYGNRNTLSRYRY